MRLINGTEHLKDLFFKTLNEEEQIFITEFILGVENMIDECDVSYARAFQDMYYTEKQRHPSVSLVPENILWVKYFWDLGLMYEGFVENKLAYHTKEIVSVSKHGSKRMKERLKISKKRQLREAKAAYLNGVSVDTYEANGVVKSYLNEVMAKTRIEDEELDSKYRGGTPKVVVYNGGTYIFKETDDANILITVYPVPDKIKANFVVA